MGSNRRENKLHMFYRETNHWVYFHVQLLSLYKKQQIGIQDKSFECLTVSQANSITVYIFKHHFSVFEECGRHGDKVVLVFFYVLLGIKTMLFHWMVGEFWKRLPYTHGHTRKIHSSIQCYFWISLCFENKNL